MRQRRQTRNRSDEGRRRKEVTQMKTNFVLAMSIAFAAAQTALRSA